METATLNINEIKKELMKSKVNANFSHYISGNLYYTVKVLDGTYQFPISTVDTHEVLDEKFPDTIQFVIDSLSKDLGTTAFNAEMRGSELNRWISKAFEKGEFVKVG